MGIGSDRREAQRVREKHNRETFCRALTQIVRRQEEQSRPTHHGGQTTAGIDR